MFTGTHQSHSLSITPHLLSFFIQKFALIACRTIPFSNLPGHFLLPQYADLGSTTPLTANLDPFL